MLISFPFFAVLSCPTYFYSYLIGLMCIIFAWLMSEKVGRLIAAQQFCKWLIRVWKGEWETFKELSHKWAKGNHIYSTSGMKYRQSERRKPLWKVYCTYSLVVKARLNFTSSDFKQDLSLENIHRVRCVTKPFDVAERMMLPLKTVKPCEKFWAWKLTPDFWEQYFKNNGQ